MSCSNRKGRLSVALEVLDGDFEGAAKRGVSLVNEIFHGFLRGPYHDYMVTVWGEPEE